MRNIFKNSRSGWVLAVYLTQSYLDSPVKASNLLSRLPEDLSCGNRKICQFLFLGVIRHKLLIQALFGRLILKKARPLVYALLCVAGFEVFNSEPSRCALVVHHAVEQAKKLLSPPEVRFVNACLRKLPEALSALTLPVDSPTDPHFLSLKYSHPLWLVNRWLSEFGPLNTLSLLKWDQEPSSVYFRILNKQDCLTQENFLGASTPWEGFYQANSNAWEKVVTCAQKGDFYIQDPATRLGPALLDVEKGESVLDLCAAPGGKSLLLAENLQDSEGILVSVDLPGERFKQLEENLAKVKNTRIVALAHNVLSLDSEVFVQRGLPAYYPAVFIDVPCSNTGVLRRRPDAKWRLEPEAIAESAYIQLQLLKKAAFFAAPFGRLVYSTCSIEKEENEDVVSAFLRENTGFELVSGGRFFPWDAQHDGGGVFLIVRKPLI